MGIRICSQCLDEYLAKSNFSKVCNNCKYIKKICLKCSNEFVVTFSFRDREFCCVSCHCSYKMKFLREETRIKYSLTSTGRVHSPETRKLISFRAVQRHNNKVFKYGELVRKVKRSYKFKQWRKQILARDGHRCVECGDGNKELHVHHIKAFKYLMVVGGITDMNKALAYQDLWATSNGQVLCIDCHRKTANYISKGKKFKKE